MMPSGPVQGRERMAVGAVASAAVSAECQASGATRPVASAAPSERHQRVRSKLAEREGFEPSIRLPVCRISSAVLSTTQPPLRSLENPFSRSAAPLFQMSVSARLIWWGRLLPPSLRILLGLSTPDLGGKSNEAFAHQSTHYTQDEDQARSRDTATSQVLSAIKRARRAAGPTSKWCARRRSRIPRG